MAEDERRLFGRSTERVPPLERELGRSDANVADAEDAEEDDAETNDAAAKVVPG